MLTLVISLSVAISAVFSASCGGSTWEISYSGHNCDYSGGVYTITCPDKGNPGTCGMRLDGKPRLGQGTYSVKMKAAKGDGLNTAWYLFSYGRYNDKSQPWNEIDIEILGKQIYGGQTRVWTNVWTGHYVQHGQFVTLNWDASTGYHTYVIQIDSSKIYWKFDGSTKRTWTYTGYSDLVSTINNQDFQAEMVLWGLNDNSWPDMGGMYNNNQGFPQRAYFKSVTLNECTSCSPANGGGSSGGSSGKIKITNKNGLNQWWYAVVLSEIPSGVNIDWVKTRGNGQSSWETGVKEWDYYKFTKNTPYSAPFDFKIRTTSGQVVTSHNIIKNLNAGTSAYMTQSVSSSFTAEEEAGSESMHWTAIFAIILLVGCFCCILVGGVFYFDRKRKARANGNGASFKEDSKDTELATNAQDTPVGDGGADKTGTYDMSPVHSADKAEDEEELEIEVETTIN